MQPLAAFFLLAAAPLYVMLAHAQVEEEGDLDDNEEILSQEQLRALHRKFDADGSGKVSFQEILGFATGMAKAIAVRDIVPILEEIDVSKDGKLSLEEHLNDIHNQADSGDEEELKELEMRKAVEAAKHAAADVNKDGVLDQHELPALFYPEIHEDVLSVVTADALKQKDRNHNARLSDREFWDVEGIDGDEAELSDEERLDFQQLDKNGDGELDEQELRDWESGRYHTREAMKKLFEIADRDNDMQLTAEELAAARDEIGSSDAQYHLIEWAEHHEL